MRRVLISLHIACVIVTAIFFGCYYFLHFHHNHVSGVGLFVTIFVVLDFSVAVLLIPFTIITYVVVAVRYIVKRKMR